MNAYVSGNAGYQFSNTLAAEFFGNFRSGRHQVQGSYISNTSHSIEAKGIFGIIISVI
jgi:hypothetical protein